METLNAVDVSQHDHSVPALVTNMPNADYHAWPAVSASGLKLITRSPAHYYHAPQREPSRAMVIGSAIHCALLEPDAFASRYVCAGTADRRASEYKAAVKAMGTDEYVLTQPEHDRITTMQQAVLSHNVAGDYLAQRGHRELSVFSVDPATGVQIKCRPDLITDGGVMIDLKKTQDARPEAFARAVANYQYDLAAAHYIDTWKAATGETPARYLLIAIEEQPPHGIGVYELPADWIERGRHQRNTALALYDACTAAGRWPGYEEGEQILMPPRWIEAEMDAEAAEGIK